MIKLKHLLLLSARIAAHLFFITGYVLNAAIIEESRLLKKQLLNNPDIQDHSPTNYSVV